MNMDYTPDNTIYLRSSEKLQTKNEFSGDFILPDSYEDIRKILYTSASLRPERCEITSGKLANEGRLFYTVLFEDDNGKINSVDFSSDYQMTSNADKCEGKTLIMSSPAVESLVVKLLNPRKVGIRATVDSRCKLWNEGEASMQLPESFNSEDRLSIEKKEENINQICVMTYSDSDREISEDIELDRGAEAIDEILLCNIDINVSDIRRNSDSLTLRGEVDVMTVYRSTEGNIACKNIQLPFSQSIDAPAAPENAEYFANVYIDKKSAVPAENAFGENKMIELDFSYAVSVTALVPAESRVSKDAYSTKFCTENEISMFKYSTPMPSYIYSDSRTVEGDFEGSATCLCVFSDAALKNGDGGGYEALCRFAVLVKNENGTIGIATVNDTFPLDITNGAECIGNIDIRGVQCSADNNKLKITYNFTASAVCWKNVECGYVSKIKLVDNPEEKEYKAITVCYPSADETLWDVAKKYHISENMLMSYNMINDPTEKKNVLLIPKKRG